MKTISYTYPTKQSYLLIRCRGELFFFQRVPWIVIRIGNNQLTPMEAGREHKGDRPQPLHDCLSLRCYLKSRKKKKKVWLNIQLWRKLVLSRMKPSGEGSVLGREKMWLFSSSIPKVNGGRAAVCSREQMRHSVPTSPITRGNHCGKAEKRHRNSGGRITFLLQRHFQQFKMMTYLC